MEKRNFLPFKLFGWRRQGGFTLIEITIAMLILAIGLLGLAAMTMVVQRSNLFSDRLSEAKEIASEVLKTLKTYPFTGGASAGSPLLGDAESCPTCCVQLPVVAGTYAFFNGDSIPVALYPPDYTTVASLINCQGPPEFGGSRFFWHDGKFQVPALGVFGADGLPQADIPQFQGGSSQALPSGTTDRSRYLGFMNNARPFLVYYIVNDVMSGATAVRKNLTAVVVWYNSYARRMEHVSMTTQISN